MRNQGGNGFQERALGDEPENLGSGPAVFCLFLEVRHVVFLGPIFSPGQPQRALENTGAFPLGLPPMSSQGHGATTSLPASTSVCLCHVGLH